MHRKVVQRSLQGKPDVPIFVPTPYEGIDVISLYSCNNGM